MGPEKRLVQLTTICLPVAKEYVRNAELGEDIIMKADSLKRLLNVYLEISKLPPRPLTSSQSIGSEAEVSVESESDTLNSFGLATLDDLESKYLSEAEIDSRERNPNWARHYSRARAKQVMARIRTLDASITKT